MASTAVKISSEVAERSYVTNEPQVIAAKEVLRFDSLNRFLDRAALEILNSKLRAVHKMYPEFFASLKASELREKNHQDQLDQARDLKDLK